MNLHSMEKSLPVRIIHLCCERI